MPHPANRGKRLQVRHFAIVLLVLTSCLAICQEAETCAQAGNQSELKKGVIDIARQLTGDIKNLDTRNMLKKFSTSGVGFGVQRPQIPLTDLESQFNSKSGYYCLIFDTSCMKLDENKKLWGTDPVLGKFDTSFNDWLRKAGEVDFEVTLFDNDSAKACGALVNITPFKKIDIAPERLQFEFIIRSGKWKFVNTPDTLGG